MKKSNRILSYAPLIGLLAMLGACSREPTTDVAPPTVETAPPAPPAPAPVVPLSAELSARLIRDHSPVIGPANAPVTIVEFLDPACEACAAYAAVVRQIELVYPEDVRVVVRFAAFHPGSDEAIRLLDAAHRQRKFEPVLDALFQRQDEWASHHRPVLERAWQIAGEAGLDLARARRDAKAAAAQQLLRVESEDIVALRVERTPTFYVNGQLLVDFGAEQLMDLVTQEVTRARGARP